MVYINNSSLRERDLQDTLHDARCLAKTLGITRVFDTTHLDRIGIPVFASIRPTAHKDNLCVNAGKGLLSIEAEVGAYMECIEFALAEHNVSKIPICVEKLSLVYKGERSIFDFCPPFGMKFNINQKFACVEATDIISNKVFLVPADSVLLGLPDEVKPYCYLGSSSNGLSSGNSIVEASIHGILELIERDIESFNIICDKSSFVHLDDLPHNILEALMKIENANLKFVVRYTTNSYNLHYFSAYIFEENEVNPIYICSGHGCHLKKNIALVRAITESAQGRLSFIHGGRDDLTDRYDLFKEYSKAEESFYINRLKEKIFNEDRRINYSSLKDEKIIFTDLQSVLNRLVEIIIKNGFNNILRINLSPKNSSLSVIKCIIPRMEFFENTLKRTGQRLINSIG